MRSKVPGVILTFSDDKQLFLRVVDKIIVSRQLASKVAIHNLCNITGQISQPLVYLMWRTPNSDYGGAHLLKIWRKDALSPRLVFPSQHRCSS